MTSIDFGIFLQSLPLFSSYNSSPRPTTDRQTALLSSPGPTRASASIFRIDFPFVCVTQRKTTRPPVHPSVRSAVRSEDIGGGSDGGSELAIAAAIQAPLTHSSLTHSSPSVLPFAERTNGKKKRRKEIRRGTMNQPGESPERSLTRATERASEPMRCCGRRAKHGRGRWRILLPMPQPRPPLPFGRCHETELRGIRR